MNIFCLTDYRNHFGSKWNASPYRSGMDKDYMSRLFKEAGFTITYISLRNVDLNDSGWKGKIVLYTSSEENGLYYKDFIEDIVYGLREVGAILIPDISFLKANNNKVFMEVIRKTKLPSKLRTIDARLFGTFEEMIKDVEEGNIIFPCIIKKSSGVMSRGVFLAKNKDELIQIVKKFSYSGSLRIRLKELIRSKKHFGYSQQSIHQKKFIVQPFIPGLKNDWKILIYGERYFILKRCIRKNDFRASGSGFNYKPGSDADFPMHMLDFVRNFYLYLDVPNLSIDFGYDGMNMYVFEFQAIHFGTSTVYRSNDYFEYLDGKWLLQQNNFDQEQIYVQSIIDFLKRKYA